MQLLNLFTVAGSNGDTFNTMWLPFPEDYRQAAFWVDCKMFAGSEVDIALESSMDMDETNKQTVTTTAVTGTGTSETNITTKLGGYARLNLTIPTATTQAVVSVWVLPKRD